MSMMRTCASVGRPERDGRLNVGPACSRATYILHPPKNWSCGLHMGKCFCTKLRQIAN